MKHRFKIHGRLDNASRVIEGTVVVDRASGILEVRAYRRRRVFRLPLGDVATLVVQTILRAEDREKRQAKRKRKPRRRVNRGKL